MPSTDCTFLRDRTPTVTDEQAGDAFRLLSRDIGKAGIFVGHWAGHSEWERHPAGDEIVMVLDERPPSSSWTATTSTRRVRFGRLRRRAERTWQHRFETAAEVKVLSVTPQPTDHAANRPT